MLSLKGQLDFLLNQQNSKKNLDKIMALVKENPSFMDNLIERLLKNEGNSSKLSAWAIGYLAKDFPESLDKKQHVLIDWMFENQTQYTIMRCLLRGFTAIEIDLEYIPRMYDLCLGILVNSQLPIAIKANAMLNLSNIGKRFPELLQEPADYIESRLDFESPAFTVRGKLIIHQYQKLKLRQ